MNNPYSLTVPRSLTRSCDTSHYSPSKHPIARLYLSIENAFALCMLEKENFFT